MAAADDVEAGADRQKSTVSPIRPESERDRLEAELYQLGFSVGMPTLEALAARNARIDQIQRRLAKFPPRRVVMHQRPKLPPGWTLPVDEENDHDYDPFLASPTARRE